MGERDHGEGEQAPVAAGTITTVHEGLPDRGGWAREVGRYRLGDEIARGGGGRVIAATDQWLARDVAVKVPLEDPGSLQRLVREAQLIARLEHPSIVPVHDIMRDAEGTPFYVMKLLAGETLQARIAGRSFEERIALLPALIAIAEAVAYAHHKGIVHRDLKPSNVIVGEFGETFVIDWGLARHVAASHPADAEATRSVVTDGVTVDGAIVGTPGYMAPEQARGEPIDVRTDVYALGAMLYTLIAGHPPFSELQAREIVEAVRTRPPPRVEEREPRTPADLAAIVRTAMAQQASERYPSALAFRDELRRFQTGQLVRSHDYSPWQRMRRFVGRHRAVVAAVVAVIIALSVGGALSVQRISRARSDAERALGDAERRRDQLALAQARAALPVDPTTALAWIKTYPPGAEDWTTARRIVLDALALDPARHVFRDVLASQVSHHGDLVALTREQRLDVCQLDSGSCRSFAARGEALVDVTFAPDDATIATVGEAGDVRLWSTATGESHVVPGAAARPRVSVLAFSPDGKNLAMLDGPRIDVVELATGMVRKLDSREPGAADMMSFTASGDAIAVTSLQRRGIRVWDIASGTSRQLATTTPTGAEVTLSPDGKTVWFCPAGSPTVEAWPRDGGAPRVLSAHKEEVLSLSLSRDGRTLLSGDNAGEVRLWDVATGKNRLLGQHASMVLALELSPDATWAASAGGEGIIWLWHLPSGDRHELRGHGDAIEQLRFSADGRHLMSRGTERTVRIWDLPPPRRRVVVMPAQTRASPAFSADGKLAWGADDGMVRICDDNGDHCRVLNDRVEKLNVLEFSRDGRLLAAGQSGRVWDPPFDASRLLWSDHLMLASFSRDGSRIAAPGNFKREVYVFDAASGRRERTVVDSVLTQSAVLSGNGRRLAFGDEAGNIGWLDLPEGALHMMSIGDSVQVPGVALSADGARLAATAADGAVRVWGLPSEQARILGRHDGIAQAIRFSPDDRVIASGGWDHTVRWWSLDGGGPQVGRGHHGPVVFLAFSPDGRLLASGSEDGLVGIWNVATGEGRVMKAHAGSVRGLAFSPDGRRLATTGEDAELQIWNVDAPAAPQRASAMLNELAQRTTVTLDNLDRPATQR
jgi:WD40 repeat protein